MVGRRREVSGSCSWGLGALTCLCVARHAPAVAVGRAHVSSDTTRGKQPRGHAPHVAAPPQSGPDPSGVGGLLLPNSWASADQRRV